MTFLADSLRGAPAQGTPSPPRSDTFVIFFFTVHDVGR